MSEQTVIIQDQGPVRTFTLNRPDKLNAVNEALKDEIMAALAEADQDNAVKAAIITGAGRAFSAGADLQHFADLAQAGDPELTERFTTQEFPNAFAEFSKPLIAAINGPAVGWGFTMPLMCDLRLASSNALFIAGFVRVGVTPEFGSSFHLPRLIGMGKAMELVLTARRVEADEALDLGLVGEVTQPEDLLGRAMHLAQTIAAMPASAVRMAKACLIKGASSSMAELLPYEVEMFQKAMATEEHAGAVAAMMQSIRDKQK